LKPGFRSRRIGRLDLARLAALVASLAATFAPPLAAAPQPDLGSYEVSVNTRRIDGVVFAARDDSDRLYIDESALRTWRVR